MGAIMVKWTDIVLQYTEIMFYFCQRPKSSSKGLFKLDIFLMMTSIFVLNTQM